MNLLAHAYLSFNNPDILAGNMISDFVKGKKLFDYTPQVQKGIRLHRAIDHFTDNHPATRDLKEFFRADYRLYAGPLADIVYDYFLANDTSEFTSPQALESFTLHTYLQLREHPGPFPPVFQAMLPHMQQQNWLYNYRFTSGIEKSFRGLAHRAKYLSETDNAFSIFCNHLPEMEVHYRRFFPMLKNFSGSILQELLEGE